MRHEGVNFVAVSMYWIVVTAEFTFASFSLSATGTPALFGVRKSWICV